MTKKRFRSTPASLLTFRGHDNVKSLMRSYDLFVKLVVTYVLGSRPGKTRARKQGALLAIL